MVMAIAQNRGPLARNMMQTTSTAAVYAETRNMSIVENTVTDTVEMANKTQNTEVVAQYQFDFGLRPAISYVQSKGKQLNGAGGSADLAKYIQAGATYYFNKT